MYEVIDKISEWMPIYLMVFVRLSGMLVTMPILGYRTVAVRIRVMLAFILTLIIAPALGVQPFSELDSVLSVVLVVMKELFIGLMIGFGARVIFEGFAMAGSFIGRQMGMAMMNVLDPSSQEQQPIITQFWMFVMVIFFLITNSHYFLIETLFQNFAIIKPGSGYLTAGVGQAFVYSGTILFEMALKFAAPAMIFLLLVDISIAFIARVMPQMNVFFVSLPLKVGVGIVILIISLRLFQVLFGYVYGEVENFVLTIMNRMAIG